MDKSTWGSVNRLRAWLDENAGEQSERERRLLRVLKIGEEYGEVAEAVHGALGTNPRKGPSHSWDDVRNELIDVAVTALVALATLDADGEAEFDARLQYLVDRALPPPPDDRA
ncbi:MazG-like family protein [Streptomyces sp. NPDC020965]|uniref:MazG-like family protein n=1 Tax=Streptomyces sp. NPDC020965 TaxID=3365105 RepID=UPI003797ACA7